MKRSPSQGTILSSGTKACSLALGISLLLGTAVPAFADTKTEPPADGGSVASQPASPPATPDTTTPTNAPTNPDTTQGQTPPPQKTQEASAATPDTTDTKAAPAPQDSQSGVPSPHDESSDLQKTLSLKPDQSSGALTYEYPITVPPGRNGLQPDIQLAYNNQTAVNDSPLGYGWSFNLPYIERMNKTGVDALYSSSYFESSLSGELSPVASSTTAYSAKVDDGSFIKYSFDGTVWTAVDKQGTTYTFGMTDAGRLDDPSDQTHIYRWMLEEVRDTNGNYVTYQYVKDGAQVYPSKITYTNHGSVPGIFEVDFGLENRPDHTTSYASGFAVATNERVSQISTKMNGTAVQTYMLAYSQSPESGRSLLSSITESAQGVGGSTTLPPTVFTYTASKGSGWNPFEGVYENEFVLDPTQNYTPADVNGDGNTDIIRSNPNTAGAGTIFFNDGNDQGWGDTSSSWSVPAAFEFANGLLVGYTIADFNGDGYPDLLNDQEHQYAPAPGPRIYLNDKTHGWVEAPNFAPPAEVQYNSYTNHSGFVAADVNGDGLADLLVDDYRNNTFTSHVFINEGNGGWQEGPWQLPGAVKLYPQGTDDGVTETIVADVNGDGLADILYQDGYPTGTLHVMINNGVNGWTEDPDWTIPSDARIDFGAAVTDVNGDGLPDLIQRDTGPQNGDVPGVYLQKADGTGWSLTPDTRFNIPYDTGFSGSGMTTFADENGDSVADLFDINTMHGVYFSNGSGKSDLLATVTYPAGGESDITYTQTPLETASSTLANPNLPFPLDVVSEIDTNDGSGNLSKTTYAYAGGAYYYNGPLDRKFAGFAVVTQTDPSGNVTKTYFHQGTGTDAAHGEYQDSEAKIGKPYRIEKYDGTGKLYQVTINTWDTYPLDANRSFVKLIRTVTSAYDGNTTHKDTAEEYAYDNATGNLTQKTTWGEVHANDDGTFADTGTDKAVEALSYAAGGNVSGLPDDDTVTDQNGTKVRETRTYYDNLPLGTVSKGNPTRQEQWIGGTTYAATGKTYNAYGLPLSATDALGNKTTYAYNAQYLQPASMTNALGQKTSYTYDYASGKVKQTTDPNGLSYLTVYDGLGRILSEKEPDPLAASSTVVKTSYVYTDTSGATSIERDDYLDASTMRSTFDYFDGLNRLIQERTESATGYNAKDTAYAPNGLVAKESLPYASTGTAKTSPTSVAALYTTYTYDPLNRVLTATNALGSTRYMYDQWRTAITDADGNTKNFYQDAYGNLIKVVERNQGANYTTSYMWDLNKDLTKITDALGNVRDFTYDGLGRNLSAEDLHAPADSTFGVWNYTYDAAGNLTQSLNPRSQMVKYGYDALNRPTTEDYQGVAGTEITYAYDTCTNGIGKLCSVAMPGTGSSYLYDTDGNMSAETDKTGSSPLTTYFYHDRQGNQTFITYPDGAQAAYTYDAAGFVNAVQEREAGGSWLPIVSNMTYSPLGQIASMSYGNGVTSTNTYDPAKLYRLTNKKTLTSTSTALQNISYTYDKVGNIKTIADTSQTKAARNVSYQYDDLYRLTSAVATVAASTTPYSIAYTYDALGNILSAASTTYAYSASGYADPDAVTSVGTAPYTYDQDGNLLTNGSLTNTWNYKDQLTKSVVGSTTSTYLYDQDGNRVEMKVGSATTYYPNQYYSVTGAKKEKYMYAGDLLMATVETNASTTHAYYIHSDHLGGTNIVTDSTGNPVETLDYYPYGGVRVDDKAANFGEPKQYIGQYDDTATNLDYLNARYYSSTVGKFISQDPVFLGTPAKQNLRDPQSLNSYSYSTDNPVTNEDPTGKVGVASILPGLSSLAASLTSLSVSLAASFVNSGLHPENFTNNLAIQNQQLGHQIRNWLQNPDDTYNAALGAVQDFVNASDADQGTVLGHAGAFVAPFFLGPLGAEGEALDSVSIADTIASGHAYTDHVIDEGKYVHSATGQPISQEEFADHIEDVMTNPSSYSKSAPNGRTVYFNGPQQGEGTFVVYNAFDPPDYGSSFPSTYRYYLKQ